MGKDMPHGYATCANRYWTADTISESISVKQAVCRRGTRRLEGTNMLPVARLDDARTHDETDHHAMTAIQTQGSRVTDLNGRWGGITMTLSGRSAETGASSTGKVHFVLAGHLAAVTARRNAEFGPSEFNCLSTRPERGIKDRASLRTQMQLIASN